MGVRWLTTYVRGVDRLVSTMKERPCRPSTGTRHDTDNNGASISHTEEEKPSSDPATFVVDGWALIFHIWLNLFGEAIRSLDYGRFEQVVRITLQAWFDAAIDVVVVLDGPLLPSKLPTVAARRAVAVGCNQGFMHSAAHSRMSRSLQTSSNIVPPQLYAAFVSAIRSLPSERVQLHFAPTEADSMVAEMASDRPNAYALSQDSDFFILCARGKGCAGYVPLDSIEYVSEASPLPGQAQHGPGEAGMGNQIDDEQQGGFEVVGKKRRGAKKLSSTPGSAAVSSANVGRQIDSHPPLTAESSNLISVRFRSYRPDALASHLQLPPSLLPLFAAIVGNDYTTSLQSTLLLRHLENAQRIPSVAEVLRTEWIRMQAEAKAGGPGRRGGGRRLALTSSLSHDFDDGRSDAGSSATATPTRNTPGAHRAASTIVPHDPVRAMVDAIVAKLLAQAEAGVRFPRTVASGEREMIVDSILDSAATYTLLTHSDAPHLASPSALFFGEGIGSLLNRKEHVRIASPQGLMRYREAYREGHFRESLIEIMTQRIFLTRHMPEDPDQPSFHTYVLRDLRQWLFAVLFEVWGMTWARKEWDAIPEASGSNDEDPEAAADAAKDRLGSLFLPDRTYREGERPDDVISVDTESSSEVELESELDEDDQDDLPSRPGSVLEEREQDKPAPGVVEYVRSGTMYAQHLVRITPLVELLRSDADNDDPSPAALPTSLADLLAQHEASRPGPTEIVEGADRPDRLTQQPESDPPPPPVALAPLSTRLDLFLYAHDAATPSMRALSPAQWLPACVLRCLISGEAKRLRASNRLRVNWSRAEVEVAWESMVTAQTWTEQQRQAETERAQTLLPTTRAIHLASAVQVALEGSTALAQALLLPIDQPGWPAPHTCFFGPTFHIGMARIHEGVQVAGDEAIDGSGVNGQHAEPVSASLEAVLEGLEDMLGIDALGLKRERKAKKRDARQARDQQRTTPQSSTAPSEAAGRPARSHNASVKNAFAALLDADA